jgi:hypothetical protein
MLLTLLAFGRVEQSAVADAKCFSGLFRRKDHTAHRK